MAQFLQSRTPRSTKTSILNSSSSSSPIQKSIFDKVGRKNSSSFQSDRTAKSVIGSKTITKPKGFRRPNFRAPLNHKFPKFQQKRVKEEKLKFQDNWIWSFVKQLEDYTQCLNPNNSFQESVNKKVLFFTVNNFLNFLNKSKIPVEK